MYGVFTETTDNGAEAIRSCFIVGRKKLNGISGFIFAQPYFVHKCRRTPVNYMHGIYYKNSLRCAGRFCAKLSTKLNVFAPIY